MRSDPRASVGVAERLTLLRSPPVASIFRTRSAQILVGEENWAMVTVVSTPNIGADIQISCVPGSVQIMLAEWNMRKRRESRINSNPVRAIVFSESRRGGLGQIDAVCRPNVVATMHSIFERDMVAGSRNLKTVPHCAKFMDPRR
jgi:hypothetical protein